MKWSTAILLVGAMVCIGNSHGQVLRSASPVAPPLGVTQFGMPTDAKYVFCAASDCLERSLKHLANPAQATTRAKVLPEVITPMPVQVSSVSQVEIPKPQVLTEARAVKRTKQQTRRLKPRADIECKPAPQKVPVQAPSHPHARPSSGH